jgi:hypothetical protein
MSTPPHLKWVCELKASGSECEQVADRRRAGLFLLGQFAWWNGLSSVDRGTARNKLEDLGVDGSTILKRILKKKIGVCGLDCCVSALGQVVELL